MTSFWASLLFLPFVHESVQSPFLRLVALEYLSLESNGLIQSVSFTLHVHMLACLHAHTHTGTLQTMDYLRSIVK